METLYHLKIYSDLTEKSLIVSDEFKTRTDAETYKNLLSQLLASPNPRPLTKQEVNSLGLELNICEGQSDDAIIPLDLKDAIPRLWEDCERINEFIEEHIDRALFEQFEEFETQ
jgi:protein-tyrosine phosphatase